MVQRPERLELLSLDLYLAIYLLCMKMNWAQGRLEYVVLHIVYMTSVFDIIHWAIAHTHSCVCR